MKQIVNLFKLGRLPYSNSLKVQQVLFEGLKCNVSTRFSDSSEFGTKNAKFNSLDMNNSEEKGIFKIDDILNNCYRGVRNSLILVEHEPVYTIGLRSKQYDDDYIKKLKQTLFDQKLKAEFVKTNRGGLITFHGPGQMVAYPIIYLGDFKRTIPNRSVKAYVNLLELTIIDTLARVGISGAHTIREYPGVWLHNGKSKIAFIGISCKRFVTMHGISINCNCDLSWFDHIVSCGIEDKIITSVHKELFLNNNRPQKPDLNRSPIECPKDDVEFISEAFCQSFAQHFDCKLEDTELITEHHEGFITESC